MAVSKKPIRAKSKATTKTVAKLPSAPDSKPKNRFEAGVKVRPISASELEPVNLNSARIKPEPEDIELYFVLAYQDVVDEFNSLVHRPEITRDSTANGMLAVCRYSIVNAHQSNNLYYPQVIAGINLMIGWLKCHAGIDIEGMKNQFKRDGTLKAKQARLNKADILAMKIKDLAIPLIAKYPEKPATQIYGYLVSDLTSFAKAHGITTGLSEKVVTSKISAVKNSFI